MTLAQFIDSLPAGVLIGLLFLGAVVAGLLLNLIERRKAK